MAKCLQENGIDKNDFVVVSAEKSIATIVAMFGIMKNGSVYVPIDPEYPKQRIEYILNDCKPAAILYPQGNKEIDTGIFKISIGNDECGISRSVEHSAEDIAYMIYTSGTTGHPKGVLVEHYGIASLKEYFVSERGVCEDDIVMQFASFSFDAAISEITMALLIGGTLCIVSEELRNDVNALEEYLFSNKVTVGIFPPQYLSQISKIPFRMLLTAGSDSNSKIIEMFGQDREYSNDYGPTEATVCATAWKYEGGAIPRRIPIGKPIPNKQIYILDGNKLCGIGLTGELCIAGDGIARGYFHQPNLTNEKFITNPFGRGKLYRSGDMARWTADGNVEFLGRIDNQIKIRGFRIEIGEIENVMRNISGILEAVAVVEKDSVTGEPYLEAYYVSDGTSSYDDLLFGMRSHLTNYMIPSHINEVCEIPLNRNGKVDIKKIKSLIIGRKKEHALPANATESFVLQIFRSVIGNNDIELGDNFFEAGGDSLKAIGIVSALKESGIRTSVKEIIRHNSIRLFCETLEKQESEEKNVDEEEIRFEKRSANIKEFALTGIQQEIYLSTTLDEQRIAYNVPMIIKFKKKLDISRVQKIFDELQKRHIALRAGFRNTDSGILEYFRGAASITVKVEKADNIKAAFDAFLQPFDLEKDTLFRVKIVDVNQEEYLMFDSHHIVVDGLSMSILFNEFLHLYLKEDSLTPSPYDFDDYVYWNSGNESHNIQKKDLDYWKKIFKDGAEKTLIPADYSINGYVGNEGATLYRELTDEMFMAMNEFCVKNNVTPFMLLMGVYGVLTHKLTSAEDIIVGIPASGRIAQVNEMVGMFVSSIPFRMKLNNNESFIEVVNSIGESLMDALKHQNCTLNQIAKEVGLTSENGQNPFFATMFGYNNVKTSDYGKYLGCELVSFEQNMAKFDITLDANKNEESCSFVLRYNKNLYKKGTMERFMGQYIRILCQVLEMKKIPVRDIKILSDSEEKKLLLDNNNNKVIFPLKDANVTQLFSRQVERMPQE